MGSNSNDEERRKRILSKIAKFRLFDDDFMSKVFEDDIGATEFLLRTILQRDYLVVTESKGQVSVKNLRGRSVRLDIKATDRDGKLYNVEVQRTDEDAGAKRARYHSAMLDANTLLPGQDFAQLPETYVIFITENDVLNGGLPLYHIERRIEELGLAFGDESHIIYVNGKYRGDDAIGRLMHDFSCTDPDDMNSSVLAERARYLKKDDIGVRLMSTVMEELVNEILAEEKREQAEKFAVSLLKDGTYSVAKIAQLFGLPEERVKELAKQQEGVVFA